jgi:DNA polymerase-4
VGAHLSRLGRGIDDRAVESHREVKSVSHEETYPVDRRDLDGLRTEVLRMADAVATRMRQASLAGRTVTLKIRYGDFSTRTRSVTSPRSLDDGGAIARLGCLLLADLDLSGGIRLLGVGVSNLAPTGTGPAEQLSLDMAAPEHASSADGSAGGPGGGEPAGVAARSRPTRPTRPTRPAGASTTEAVDAIRRRYGAGAVGPAALLEAAGLRGKRQGDTQWGPGAQPDPAAAEGSGRRRPSH